ncbi:MAG: hypothetical protein IT208_16980 [Chthonomonadales bacterium]|nr:hypothetical protein [Chthonomonadales bacterium]
MGKGASVSTPVAVAIIVMVLAVVGFVGYRMMSGPSSGPPKIIDGQEFFKTPAASRPSDAGPSAGSAYGGAQVVRPSTGGP